jgi:ABC-type xylose transport system permease subunit
MGSVPYSLLIIFMICAAIAGGVTGYIIGYQSGIHDAVEYIMSVAGKVTINGNITANINESKIDQALAEMKNITISLLNKTDIPIR